MEPVYANRIVEAYAAEKGYPTVEKLNLMGKDEFNKGLEIWSTEYLEVLSDAGLYFDLTGRMRHPQTRQIVRSLWGWKMEEVQKLLVFRRSTEGKKHILRDTIPQAVRSEEKDIDDMIDTASLKVSVETGSTKKDKKQTQLNIDRLSHIRALEKSISKGGALREMYDASLSQHKDNVENIIPNEEAAKLAMCDKRRKRIPSLILSWFVMPPYVIFRTLDMVFDSAFISQKLGYEGSELGPKVGGSDHYILGRFSIPIVIAIFMTFVNSIAKYNTGVEEYVSRGALESAIASFPGYLIGFLIVKQFLDIPFVILTNKYGVVAEWASCKFEPLDADDFQFGTVNQSYDQQDILGQMIQEREILIAGLKRAIQNNSPYGEYDITAEDKKLSLKALEKEKRETY